MKNEKLMTLGELKAFNPCSDGLARLMLTLGDEATDDTVITSEILLKNNTQLDIRWVVARTEPITKEELNSTLELHKLWLTNNSKGERLDLSFRNLIKANLCGANFRNADLCDTIF